MSESELVQVYVRLLGEGTVVFRPAPAELLSDGRARLVATDTYDPEDEAWEFLPGSVVRVERRELGGGEVLVAVGR